MAFTQSWQLLALASAVFAALTAILGKIGVAQINSDLATFIRTVVILLVTALLLTARNEWQKPEGGNWLAWACLIASGVTTGLSWLCYFRALQLGPVSQVAPIDKLSVALVILVGWLALGEAVTLKTAVGGALIVAGSLVLAL
ncbi:EamA family transporter [Ferriphaselus sp. R-1]|uniref:EamA family transporter n=1 Tax=Ferriphaselus sp. R-1 TaxID=1485544 RepID=UPI00054D4BB3|nr:EamA family transporter [Ferriphaselus sp. R-1]